MGSCWFCSLRSWFAGRAACSVVGLLVLPRAGLWVVVVAVACFVCVAVLFGRACFACFGCLRACLVGCCLLCLRLAVCLGFLLCLWRNVSLSNISLKGWRPFHL